MAEQTAESIRMTKAAGKRILITGFGPFPGVAENASARLAERLAEAARVRFKAHQITTAVLPTEWDAGPRTLLGLWDGERPDIALHFGVAANACGLQLESRGRNHCRMDADAAGLLPVSATWRADGPDTCEASLPIDRISQALSAMGVPCCISEDAGAYLCNAILYESVQRAAVARPLALAGFVHIPTVLDPGAGGESALGWDAATAGGLAILSCSLEALDERRAATRTVTIAARPGGSRKRG